MIYAVISRDEFGTITDVMASCHTTHFDADVVSLSYGVTEWCAMKLRVNFIDVNDGYPRDATTQFQIKCIPTSSVIAWMKECIGIMDSVRLDKSATPTEAVDYVVNFVETFITDNIEQIIKNKQETDK
jgi:hypothetical protein